VKVTGSDKRCSLLRHGNNCGRRKFIVEARSSTWCTSWRLSSKYYFSVDESHRDDG